MYLCKIFINPEKNRNSILAASSVTNNQIYLNKLRWGDKIWSPEIMTDNTATAWVKKTYQTKGQDPLGVQAPSIHIYGELLPGITNATDRARY